MLPQLHQTNTTSCGMQLRQHCFSLVRPRQYSIAVEMCVCVCGGGGGEQTLCDYYIHMYDTWPSDNASGHYNTALYMETSVSPNNTGMTM